MKGGDSDSDDDHTLIQSADGSRTTGKDAAFYGQFDPRDSGDGSDDEEPTLSFCEQKDQNECEEEETEGEVAAVAYAPLQEEEFGDFHGFDSEPIALGLSSAVLPEPAVEEELKEELPAVVTPSVRRGIPPLTKDKIDTIRSAMASLNLKPPSSMSASLADTLVASKYRVGDEIQG